MNSQNNKGIKSLDHSWSSFGSYENTDANAFPKDLQWISFGSYENSDANAFQKELWWILFGSIGEICDESKLTVMGNDWKAENKETKPAMMHSIVVWLTP